MMRNNLKGKSLSVYIGQLLFVVFFILYSYAIVDGYRPHVPVLLISFFMLYYMSSLYD